MKTLLFDHLDNDQFAKPQLNRSRETEFDLNQEMTKFAGRTAVLSGVARFGVCR